MDDKECVEKLLANDALTIKEFFFQRCRPALVYIGQYFCKTKQTPEEMIGEFYEFLSENDWHKLRIFRYTCSLNSYVTIIASRYFQARRNREIESLSENVEYEQSYLPSDTVFMMQDVNGILQKMLPLDRFLLTRILLDGDKPSDILDEAKPYILSESNSKSFMQSREQLAGYVYTRYNRAKKSFAKQMYLFGYGK